MRDDPARSQNVLRSPDPAETGATASGSRCLEHDKVLPHYRCDESEKWLDRLESLTIRKGGRGKSIDRAIGDELRE